MSLVALLPASAWALSVDDLAMAAQRGMSQESLKATAADVEGPFSSEDVVKLLRSGVSAEVIGQLAPGHPTVEEVQQAEEAGPLAYHLRPPERQEDPPQHRTVRSSPR